MKKTLRCFIFFLIWLHRPAGVLAEEVTAPAADQAAPKEVVDEDLADVDESLVEEEIESLVVSDPIESFNRGAFWSNDKFYFYLLKPVARAFRIIPEPARVSLSNFFSNYSTPPRFVNCGLQLKFKYAGTELARFVLNTTIGIGGLFDPARSYLGLMKKDEDFGQTLGVYGVGPGLYLVLPLLGPSNLRDGIGLIVDSAMNPVGYIAGGIGALAVLGGQILDTVNATSLDRDTYEGIKRDSLDPYLFIRDAYAQNRDGKIKQ